MHTQPRVCGCFQPSSEPCSGIGCAEAHTTCRLGQRRCLNGWLYHIRVRTRTPDRQIAVPPGQYSAVSRRACASSRARMGRYGWNQVSKPRNHRGGCALAHTATQRPGCTTKPAPRTPPTYSGIQKGDASHCEASPIMRLTGGGHQVTHPVSRHATSRHRETRASSGHNTRAEPARLPPGTTPGEPASGRSSTRARGNPRWSGRS